MRLWVHLALAAGAALSNATAAAGGTARPLYFEHLTARDGLSQGTVMSLLQDSQGYLWIGTESGLDRYDGYSIKEYRRQRGDGHGLASDYVWAIAEDSRHDLWLATDGGGVERWDRARDQFVRYKHDAHDSESLGSDSVRTLLIDTQGRIWAGTQGQGLDLLDPVTGKVRHFRHRDGDPRSLPADMVCVLYTDHAGRTWVGTDGGLSEYQPATDDFVNYGNHDTGVVFTDPHVRAIREDHTGALWVGTLAGGLDRLDPRSGHVTAYRHDAHDPHSLSHDHVWSILEDDAQRLWVATADGLSLFNPGTGTFVRYGNDTSDPHSLRASYVMSLYQDRGGVLWVGTREGGASHWNPNSWQLGHYLTPTFRDTSVNAFADDGRGTVWVGTIGAGLIEIDVRSGRERRDRKSVV